MGNYPREVYLDQETEDKLASYIRDVYYTHAAEKTEHLQDLLRWQKEYWAKPTNEIATFPFRGAATIVVPLSAIAIETVHARNMTQRFALPQLVSAHAVNPEWESAAAPFERFLNRELLDEMKIRRPLGDCYLEAEKYGTMIGKVGYEKTIRSSIRQVGESEEEVDVIVYDGAVLDAVPDARFLMPHESRDPQTAQWCGEEHSETPYNVMMLEQAGAFRPGTIIDGPNWESDPTQISRLHSWINRTMNESSPISGNKFERAQEELEHTKAQWPKRIDWLELYIPWDVDKTGRLKELIVHFHYDSNTFMSIRYNHHTDLRRPYRTAPYFPVEHRWRGIGICKMNEQFQKEITVQHRQRIDNATLANMRMIKISKLAGYGPKEPVFPGKMWFLDDMSHIDTLQMGEIYPSSYSNEQATLLYSQQRLTVNEITLGQPQAGTPGTATSDLARIQEGNRKHDFIYQNFTEFTEEIITDIADVIWQFGPRNIEYFDSAENGGLVKAVLEMPVSGIRDGLLIELKASTQQHNRVLDRQNWVQIAPVLQQYYEGLLNLAMIGQLGPQVTQIIVMKGINAATEAARQFLESYDVRNIDRMILKELEELMKRGLQSAGVGSSANGGTVSSQQNPGMEQLARAFSGFGAGGNGVSNRIPGR